MAEGHTNGTIVKPQIRKPHRPTGLSALTLVGLVVLLVGVVGVMLANRDLDRIEGEAPSRLAAAGGSLTRLVPVLVTDPRSASQASVDPRLASAYASSKRSLQLWVALAGVGVSLALFGLAPFDRGKSADAPRSRTGSFNLDLAAVILVLSVGYGTLGLFEPG